MMSSCTSAKVCTSSSAAAASITAGSSMSPPAPTIRARAERGSQPLAAGGDEVPRARRADRPSAGSTSFQRVDLGGEQRVDALLDTIGDGIERVGKRGGPGRRAGHGERLRRGLRGVPIVGCRLGRHVACAAVADFLSDEWIAELALACVGARTGHSLGSASIGRDRFVIEPVVTRRTRIAARSGTASRSTRAPAVGGAASESRPGRRAARDRLRDRGRALAREPRMRRPRWPTGACGSRATSPGSREHAAALARLDDLFARCARRRPTTTLSERP